KMAAVAASAAAIATGGAIGAEETGAPHHQPTRIAHPAHVAHVRPARAEQRVVGPAAPPAAAQTIAARPRHAATARRRAPRRRSSAAHEFGFEEAPRRA